MAVIRSAKIDKQLATVHGFKSDLAFVPEVEKKLEKLPNNK